MRSIHSLVFVAVALVSGGCTAVDTNVPEAARVSFTKVDSPIVGIGSTQLERQNGRLVLSGYVVRRWPAASDDTTKSHVKITLIDAHGAVLRTVATEFEPRVIPHGHKMPGYAKFLAELEPLPDAASRIEIRAYEDGENR